MYFYYPLEGPAQVKIEIYNVAGEKVVVLEEDQAAPGAGRTAWDIRDIAPGIYLYRIRFEYASGSRTTGWKKLVIVKK